MAQCHIAQVLEISGAKVLESLFELTLGIYGALRAMVNITSFLETPSGF